MDACEKTAVPTSLPVEPLDLPSQDFRNGPDVDNGPAPRNMFEVIFEAPSVPERVTTPPNPPPTIRLPAIHRLPIHHFPIYYRLPAAQEKVRKFHRRHNKGQSGRDKEKSKL
ncbi:hypothetical protein MRX96_020658 [Rhipicephalus microplus]